MVSRRMTDEDEVEDLRADEDREDHRGDLGRLAHHRPEDAGATGYRPIESLLAVAPGPGEVLLDDDLMQQAWEAGRRLGRGEMEASQPPPNVCPTCRCDAFVLSAEGGAACPICGRQAGVALAECKLSLHFKPEQRSQERWSPEAWQRHIDGWVVATGPRFLARRPEIRARRGSYRAVSLEWLLPPARGESESKGPGL